MEHSKELLDNPFCTVVPDVPKDMSKAETTAPLTSGN